MVFVKSPYQAVRTIQHLGSYKCKRSFGSCPFGKLSEYRIVHKAFTKNNIDDYIENILCLIKFGMHEKKCFSYEK